VHEFHTPEAEQLIQAALKDKKLAHTSHRNLKSFLSGAFKFAKRNGAIDRENPIADTSIPKGKRPSNTYAYSFDEVVSMLAALEEPCRTLVLVASLTGLRISEVLGLKWEDFSEDGDQLTVTRGVVNGIEGLTKNDASASVVPIVPPVRDALAEHKARTSGVGWVFSSSKGSPLWEQNLVRRDIKPKLKLKKIVWHGWHACRRGVGTILYELGILPVYIQAILRHADQDVTLKHYIKPVETATTAAMSKLADAFGKAEEKRKRA
jgi:integrase